MLSFTGRLLLYYNPHSEPPLVWCVRGGEWELALVSINATGVDLETHYRPAAERETLNWQPSAWFECTGTLTVSPEGHGIITPGSARTFLDGDPTALTPRPGRI